MCSPKSPLNNVQIKYDALGSVQVVIANKDSIIDHTTSSSNNIPSEEEEYKDDHHGRPSPPPKVTFGDVTVHVHYLTLGDNPGGATPGPPLTLEWERESYQHFVSVDEHAKSGSTNRCSRRHSTRE